MSDKLLAIIIDDDVRRSTGLRKAWETIIGSVYRNFEVSYVHDINDTSQIFKARNHIFIVDNVFPHSDGREINNRGVDFIKDNKCAYADCLFILATGATFQVDVLGNKFPNPDLIVTKTTLTNFAYQHYIAKRIKNLLRRLPVGQIVFEDAKEAKMVSEFTNELRSIAEQCSFAVQEAEYPISQINLRRLGGGYSGSHVFKAEFQGIERYKNTPFVFKVSEDRSVSEEVQRYNLFARLQLSHDLRVDLVGAGQAGIYSGALYALAFGNPGQIASATTKVTSGDFTSIDTVIERVLMASNIGWYKACREVRTIEDFYNNSAEFAPGKDGGRLERLHSVLGTLLSGGSQANEDRYTFGKIRVEHIRRYLKKFDGETVPETICHGDLNTNNIIFGGPPGGIAVIDFEYTGFDTIYKDFISLEGSFRTYWSAHAFSRKEDFTVLFRGEVALLEGKEPTRSVKDCPALGSYFATISKIRAAAEEVLAVAGARFDRNQYALALGFYMLKLVGLNIWDKSSDLKIIACLAAACSYVDGK